jgi:hypothetical protein
VFAGTQMLGKAEGLGSDLRPVNTAVFVTNAVVFVINTAVSVTNTVVCVTHAAESQLTYHEQHRCCRGRYLFLTPPQSITSPQRGRGWGGWVGFS